MHNKCVVYDNMKSSNTRSHLPLALFLVFSPASMVWGNLETTADVSSSAQHEERSIQKKTDREIASLSHLEPLEKNRIFDDEEITEGRQNITPVQLEDAIVYGEPGVEDSANSIDNFDGNLKRAESNEHEMNDVFLKPMEEQINSILERRLYERRHESSSDVKVNNFLSDHATIEKLRKRENASDKKRGKRGKSDKDYKNICLEPLDTYRTCYQRSSDPSNNLKKDEIQRNEYNQGAHFYKKGKEYFSPKSSSKSSKSGGSLPLEPYTPPFVKSNEKLILGTLHLELNQDSTTLSCDDRIAMEEIILEFLKDNVGSPKTFSPVCVSSLDWSFAKDVPNGSKTVVQTTACQVDITYVIKRKYKNNIDGQGGRRATEDEVVDYTPGSMNVNHRELANVCSSKDRAVCCSGTAINSNADISKTCADKGCSKKNCPKRSKKKRNNDTRRTTSAGSVEESTFGGSVRRLRPYIDIPNKLHARDFNSLLNKYTDFNPEQTRAVIGAFAADEVASCSVNRYMQENYDIPFGCDEYEEDNCINNEDRIFKKDERFCRSSSSDYLY